jgi:hypothetical protein
MKKALFLLFCWGTIISIYSQQYVSLTKEQGIPQIGLINSTIPVYILKEETPGATSVTDAYYIVTGNEKAGPYEDCSRLFFSSDGKTVAYSAKTDGQWYVVAGNEKAGPYEDCRYLLFFPDGRMVYSAKMKGQWYVFTGDEKAGPYDDSWNLHCFSPDGKTVAYNAEIDGQWYVVAGNEKTESSNNCRDLTFAPDGKTLAYAIETDRQWFIITGKDKFGPYANYGRISFSPDGKIVAYKAETDDQWCSKVIVDGKEYTGSNNNGVIVYIADNRIYIR